MSEPTPLTDEELKNFSDGPLKVLDTYNQNPSQIRSYTDTNDLILRTITPKINSRTLVMHQELAPRFKFKSDIIKKRINSGETLSDEAIQRLQDYDKDMYALYRSIHPAGGRRTRGARNKKRSRSRGRKRSHKKRCSRKRLRSRS